MPAKFETNMLPTKSKPEQSPELTPATTLNTGELDAETGRLKNLTAALLPSITASRLNGSIAAVITPERPFAAPKVTVGALDDVNGGT